MNQKYIKLSDIYQLSEEDKLILINLLREKEVNNEEISRWKKNVSYIINNQEIILSHTIVKRISKSTGKLHYEIIDKNDLIGRGAFGKVYPIIASFSIENEKLDVKNKNKLIKVQTELRRGTSSKEAKLSPSYMRAKSTSLWLKHPKPSYFIPEPVPEFKSGMVMSKLPGVPLFEILRNIDNISNNQKFDLIISLLEGVVNDVHERKVVHADLDKPGNILIDLQPDFVRAYIIDFGIARSENKYPKRVDNQDILKHIYIILDAYLRNPQHDVSVTEMNKIKSFMSIRDNMELVNKLTSLDLLNLFKDIHHDFLNRNSTKVTHDMYLSTTEASKLSLTKSSYIRKQPNSNMKSSKTTSPTLKDKIAAYLGYNLAFNNISAHRKGINFSSNVFLTRYGTHHIEEKPIFTLLDLEKIGFTTQKAQLCEYLINSRDTFREAVRDGDACPWGLGRRPKDSKKREDFVNSYYRIASWVLSNKQTMTASVRKAIATILSMKDQLPKTTQSSTGQEYPLHNAIDQLIKASADEKLKHISKVKKYLSKEDDKLLLIIDKLERGANSLNPLYMNSTKKLDKINEALAEIINEVRKEYKDRKSNTDDIYTHVILPRIKAALNDPKSALSLAVDFHRIPFSSVFKKSTSARNILNGTYNEHKKSFSNK